MKKRKPATATNYEGHTFRLDHFSLKYLRKLENFQRHSAISSAYMRRGDILVTEIILLSFHTCRTSLLCASAVRII